MEVIEQEYRISQNLKMMKSSTFLMLIIFPWY